MPPLDDPFRAADALIADLADKADIIVVDFHAEATSEKMAMAFYLDGRVGAVVGTHTHVQTADERIMPRNTAAITDLGMTGGLGGVIGMDAEISLQRQLNLSRGERMRPCEDDLHLQGAVVELDPTTGLARSIDRVSVPYAQSLQNLFRRGLMSARLMKGSELSGTIRREIATEVEQLVAEGTHPCLTAVLVGNDSASELYVRKKAEACERVGMRQRTERLPADVSAPELIGLIDGLNADPGVHGILVQLPLPDHLSQRLVLECVDPDKDVDGFHPLNVGRAFVGDPRGFVPATPAGIMEMIRAYKIPTYGRHAVIVGRSLIVGKPLASLLMAPGADATVTLTHRHTRDLAAHTRMADILIVAVGKANLITADMVKPGVTVFDVGISRIPDGTRSSGSRLVGDVDFDAVSEVASAITPVPGGVGPMTITSLLRNTLEAARRAASQPATVS